MKKIVLDHNEYEVIKDYKNAFYPEEITDKYTDYFEEFDYILGDYSYDKLRLKGFCNVKNKNYKEWNDYNKMDEYLKNFCSYDCRYFILKKIKQNPKENDENA